jgi:hypothetical protein
MGKANYGQGERVFFKKIWGFVFFQCWLVSVIDEAGGKAKGFSFSSS